MNSKLDNCHLTAKQSILFHKISKVCKAQPSPHFVFASFSSFPTAAFASDSADPTSLAARFSSTYFPPFLAPSLLETFPRGTQQHLFLYLLDFPSSESVVKLVYIRPNQSEDKKDKRSIVFRSHDRICIKDVILYHVTHFDQLQRSIVKCSQIHRHKLSPRCPKGTCANFGQGARN